MKNTAYTLPRFLECAVLMACVVVPAAGQDAWLVDRDAKDLPRVRRLPAEQVASGKALALWSQGAPSNGGSWPPVGVPKEWDAPADSNAVEPTVTRSASLTGSSSLEFGQFTMQLDQLRGASATRDLGSAFLTPRTRANSFRERSPFAACPRTRGANSPPPRPSSRGSASRRRAGRFPSPTDKARLPGKISPNSRRSFRKASPPAITPCVCL